MCFLPVASSYVGKARSVPYEGGGPEAAVSSCWQTITLLLVRVILTVMRYTATVLLLHVITYIVVLHMYVSETVSLFGMIVRVNW